MQGLGAPPVYGPGRCTSENALLALQSKFGYSFKSAVTGSGHTGQQGVMHSRSAASRSLGKPSVKKTIFLLTFVNKDFSPPPLIIDEKTIEVQGSGPPPL